MGGQFQPFVLLTTDLWFHIEIKVMFFGFGLNLYVVNVWFYDIWFFNMKNINDNWRTKKPKQPLPISS